MTPFPVPAATRPLQGASQWAVMYWPRGVDGYPPEERVQLILTPAFGREASFLMTTAEAHGIVRTLTTDLQDCISGAGEP